MKSASDHVLVNTCSKFKLWDRIKLLFGWRFETRIATPVTFDMKRGLRVGKSITQEWVTPPWRPRYKPGALEDSRV